MSAAEAWPTEDLATAAVDKAARKFFEDRYPEPRMRQYDDLMPSQKLALRQSVLPIVWAALTDLPDPRYAAWTEGYVAGSSDGAFEASGSGNIPGLVYPHENPYPSGL